MTTKVTDYAFRRKLDLPYEQAIERVTAALKEEGFGILTQIDVKKTLKEKLKVDFRKYTILGACYPPLAHQSLNVELEIGLLLPCNVIVYEEDEGSAVAILDPTSMLDVVDDPDLEPISQEARTRLKRVIELLA